MEDIHELRFAVYCKEKQYLDASRYPDGKEYDEFDAYSVHFAARDPAGKILATVRLVVPGPEQRFPYEDFCTPLTGVALPPKGHVAEISRLIIAPTAREKQDKEGFSFSSLLSRFKGPARHARTVAEFTHVSPVLGQSTSPKLLLGLFRKMYRHCKKNGITHLYASMERPLARMMVRYHFNFEAISEPVDYYGPVTLFLLPMARIDADMSKGNPQLYAWFNKGLVAPGPDTGAPETA